MQTRIAHYRKLKKLTQEELSERSGIPLGTLRRWEQSSNDIRNASRLVLIANVLDCTVDDLVGRSMPAGAFYPASTESAYVSLYGTIAAGEPLEMCEVEDSYPVIRDIVDKYPEGFLLKVVGESMNKSIPNGSYAYVTPTSEVVDGKIYALNVNGFDATIKRVRRLNNGYELIPDSSDPTFETKVYNYGIDDTEQITIIGRVVYYVLPLDFEM